MPNYLPRMSDSTPSTRLLVREPTPIVFPTYSLQNATQHVEEVDSFIGLQLNGHLYQCQPVLLDTLFPDLREASESMRNKLEALDDQLWRGGEGGQCSGCRVRREPECPAFKLP